MHRFFRVRHRYILTKANALRLRYVVGTFVVSAMVLLSFLGAMGSSVAFVPKNLGIAQNFNDNTAVLASASLPNHHADDVSLVLNEIEPSSAPVDLASTLPREEVIKINPGDTVAGALQDVGVSGAEVYRIVKAISKHYDPRDVKPGQAISVELQPGDEGLELTALNMKIDPTKEVVITKDDHQRFSSELNEKDVVMHTRAANASIETSLYGSAAQAGVPASVVAEMIRIYSYEVDFQRDIRQGDKVQVLYESYETEDGDFVRYGNVLFANLIVSGKEIPVYRFDQDGSVDYFRENGQSLKRTLMQTPIDGARISSGFGMRHHPVLGYNKMHKGIDFAASRGTPIYAAGDGTIEKAGRNGGYGNYISIRHNGELKTAYAHMHKFAPGMSVGKHVKQGDVIGYVGTTGRSTGPHLHFEVVKNGQQVNPKSITSSTGQKLAGKTLESFKRKISVLKQEYVSLAQGMKFAQNIVGNPVE